MARRKTGRGSDSGNDTPPLPLAVSIPEAIRLTGISRSSLYREIEAGRLRSCKAGKRRLIPTTALSEWLAALPTSGA